ncbi:hypothetical protein GY45DRAFT_1318148 [Cubamyces sp. BRFM 1775]|nr:hypothetical protein GY45DRAFT_1318148 [Cubamyces sp. BRFM 1775]
MLSWLWLWLPGSRVQMPLPLLPSTQCASLARDLRRFLVTHNYSHHPALPFPPPLSLLFCKSPSDSHYRPRSPSQMPPRANLRVSLSFHPLNLVFLFRQSEPTIPGASPRHSLLPVFVSSAPSPRPRLPPLTFTFSFASLELTPLSTLPIIYNALERQHEVHLRSAAVNHGIARPHTHAKDICTSSPVALMGPGAHLRPGTWSRSVNIHAYSACSRPAKPPWKPRNAPTVPGAAVEINSHTARCPMARVP